MLLNARCIDYCAADGAPPIGRSLDCCACIFPVLRDLQSCEQAHMLTFRLKTYIILLLNMLMMIMNAQLGTNVNAKKT